MNYLPAILMPVKSLVLPGDIKARMKLPHVVELSESIAKRTGKRPIHLPTVEYPSKELLSGGDRLAAQLLLGYRSVWVQPVSQLTPQERRDIVRDENLHRRVVDRDLLIRQRVEEAAAEIEAARLLEEPEAERKPGRPKTAKGEAREQVAKQLGTTPDAIRAAEARAAEPEIADKCSETPLPPPVETYGLPLVTDGESAEIAAYQGALDDADRYLRRAQAALSAMEGGPFAGQARRLAAAVHQVAVDVRAARPAAVCPFCKRLRHFIVGCSGCKTTGFVAADVMLGVADELKLGGDLAQVVALGGRMVNYAYARAGKVAGAPAKAKKVRIENENGEELVPAAPVPTDDGLPF